MRKRSQRLVKFICIGVLITSMWGCHEPDDTFKAPVKLALLEEINSLRKNGCTCGNEWMPPVRELAWNSALEDAALDHANDMYRNNYFSHLSLDGTPPIVRAQNAGYVGDYVGEVIARKYHSVAEVTEGWLASESHCRALMDSLYNDMGGARREDYWVVDLGKSR